MTTFFTGFGGEQNTVIYIVAFITSALLQFLTHFATPAIFRRKPRRLETYAIGTSIIAGTLTVCFIAWGLYEAVALMWLVVMGSGAATWVGYKIDEHNELADRASEAEQREKVLEEMRNEK
jgi:hypothetical protein